MNKERRLGEKRERKRRASYARSQGNALMSKFIDVFWKSGEEIQNFNYIYRIHIRTYVCTYTSTYTYI